MGRNVLEWLAPEDRARGGAAMRSLREGGSFGEKECRFLRRDGTTFEAEVNATVFRSADGSAQGLIFDIRDISRRKAAEKALHERQSRLDSILRTAPAGIGIVVNRVLTEVNPLFCALTGRSAEELIGQSTRVLVRQRPGFRARRVGMLRWAQPQSDGMPLGGKGRADQGRAHQHFSLEPEDPSRGVTLVVVDITARKQSERDLEKMHKELLLTSRQAGIAEVVTSVLHNVGNVLTSVNVSTALVIEKIKNSRSRNVAKLGNLLEAHTADLASYLTEDATGRQLPAYLKRLGGHLAEEQRELLQEAAAIRENLEHIKDIVSVQQEYGRVCGVVEQVKVADLVQDALRMNASALVRHDVTVVREYDPAVPEITVEKHKVLQILVNLIRNAKYACDESGRKEKVLTLRTSAAGPRVRIAVKDNGVGIPAENLGRIFNFGFTTRKEGHGFGLHSAGLAAQELGGSLAAHSDGPQTGAVFTLELPVKAHTRGK